VSAYERVLRLKHIRLRGWQREALTWGTVVVAVLLALTGIVTPWGIVVLPLVAAGLLKAHDLLSVRLAAGLPLPGTSGGPPPDAGGASNGNEPPVPRTEGS
jgi:hypothetical protein